MQDKEEKEIQEFWKKNRIYEKVKGGRKGKKFFFLDGPPYATGDIHAGTALNKILKDCFIRFFRMQGYNVWDQPGYDTHGLPIENNVEKKLGFGNKADIEKFGVKNFINECKKFATQYIDVMSSQFNDLGVWMDWKNPYLTLNNTYIEGAWFTFKEAYKKGFLYKGIYPVHVCTRCETAVAYNEIVHKEVSDPSIYVKFPVKGKKNEFLLIWTTTPWTLPSNTGVMANPSADYVKIKIDSDILIMAKDLVEKVMEKIGIRKYKIIETFKGSALENLKYEHPMLDLFKFQQKLKNAHRIVLSKQYVSLEEGTGLVHTAPGHGQEDFKVSLETGLPAVSPVNMNGTFTKEAGKFAGMYVKDADELILKELEKRKLLLYEEKIKHDYPFCWRCDTPLLLISVPQWFFKVTSIRNKLIEENNKVKWAPEWASQRFANWLESLSDWPISRQRYWGIPLPIWECKKCSNIEVIGSFEELKEKSGLKKEIDFHKPDIDEVRIKCKCKGLMQRVPEVLDVWFDSGVASWASLGYPREKKLFEEMWPADLNIEGSDQIRGWWNSQLITSIMTFGKKPFEKIMLHGLVLDVHGIKMSKSLGNVVTPSEVIKNYGRDVLRFYFTSRPPWDDFYFNMNEVKETSNRFLILSNIYNFLKMLSPENPQSKKLEIEDKWILSKLNSTIKKASENMQGLKPHSANKLLEELFLMISRQYIQMIRERVQFEGKNKEAAISALYISCFEMLKMLAPFIPFLTEKTYQDYFRKNEKLESVHLHDWPKANEKMIDENLEKEMETVQQAVSLILAEREKEKVGVRWPLPSVKVAIQEKISKELEELILRQTNIKKIEIKKGEKGEIKVELNTKMTPELEAEGYAREIARRVQDARKKAGMQKHQKINLLLLADKNLKNALKKHEKTLTERTNSEKLEIKDIVEKKSELGRYKHSMEAEIRNKKIIFGFNIL